MFGGNMGAPLYENFDDHENDNGCDDGQRFNTNTGKSCCPESPTYDDTSGKLLPCPGDDDETEGESTTTSVAEGESTRTTGVAGDEGDDGDPFVGDGEVEEDEDEVEDEVEDDDDEEEDFVGNNVVEGFVGNNVVDKVNVNFVLKCVLFACLFYILAHDDSRNYLVKMLKTKKDNYIYLSSILFLIIYFILNLIL